MSIDPVDPAGLGLDPDQLARVGEHLRNAYVEPGKIPCSLALVARQGEVAYLDVAGTADLERQTPATADTIFRIYSMTKPITSVALMMLYEQGRFSLTDPVHRYLPQWRKLRVYKTGSYPNFETVPCARPMQIRDLLTHSSGLTYDFLRSTNVDYAYRKLQVGFHTPGYTLEKMIEQLAELPLEFSPGERWNYSVATDVLGYLVQVISGLPLDEYFKQKIFEPLGMGDTGFEIRPDQVERFASCYGRGPDKQLFLHDDGQASSYVERSFLGGGGGLVSTAADYLQFCKMLLNGGSLDGQRILGPRTVDYMCRNHLPGGVDMSQFATGSFSETAYEGVGFGLGFARKLDAVANGSLGSEGSFYWGGMASTLFWVDPIEDLIVIFMTQLVPSSIFNFRGQLESLIYPALMD